MAVREFQSLLAMVRSIILQMDEEDCEKRARMVAVNLDNALDWVTADDEAVALADAVADACEKLVKSLAKGVLSPGQIAAGKEDILAAVDRFEQYLHQLPRSAKAEALVKLDSEWFPGHVAKRAILN